MLLRWSAECSLATLMEQTVPDTEEAQETILGLLKWFSDSIVDMETCCPLKLQIGIGQRGSTGDLWTVHGSLGIFAGA